MKKMFALGVVVGCGFLTGQVQAEEGERLCATPGSAVFHSIPERREDILPSVHKQLAGLGRLAAKGGCSIVVTCVADPALGDDSKKVRDRQCAAAKSALARYEGRWRLRNAIAKAYSVKKVNAGDEWQAGAVYVTLR